MVCPLSIASSTFAWSIIDPLLSCWCFNVYYNTLNNLDIEFDREFSASTQLSIIIICLLTLNFACNVEEYIKDGGLNSTCQSHNALCATRSDI